MAGWSTYFSQELAAAAADGRAGSYFVGSSSGHGHYQSAVAAPPVLPAGEGSVGAVPPPAGVGDAASFKGSWTNEEDEVLREMVGLHGDRKWAAIARHLPGRIGKQCRERWINHLRPNIKKDVWTEEEDRALIEAHKSCGNRWSVIARYLPGRSENSVKNHWNATKRGLKSKRRLKRNKSEPLGGQFTLLEDYIRSQCPPTESSPAPSPSLTSHHGHAGTSAAAQPAQHLPAETLAMYHHLNQQYSSAGLGLGQYAHHMGAMNWPYHPVYGEGYYLPSLAHLNLQYGLHHLSPALQQQIADGAAHQELEAACTNLSLYPITANLLSSVDYDRHSGGNQQGYVSVGYYSEAGPSSGQEDMDVVQMASREFMARSHDEITLGLSGFK